MPAGERRAQQTREAELRHDEAEETLKSNTRFTAIKKAKPKVNKDAGKNAVAKWES